MRQRRRCLLMVALLLILFAPLSVQARAGGGGSGGGGGGGGSSSGGSHSSGYGRRASPLESLLSNGAALLMVGAGGILFAVHLHKKHRRSSKMLKKLDDMDYHWNEAVLDARVEETYYAVQKAWSEMDTETLRRYLSDHLYHHWQAKLGFMQMNQERNILKEIELIDHKIIGIGDYHEDDRDFCWYYIKGKLVDYTIDTENGQLKEGSNKAQTFVEYWRFRRKGDQFLLDEVLQKDERKPEDFPDFSEALEVSKQENEYH